MSERANPFTASAPEYYRLVSLTTVNIWLLVAAVPLAAVRDAFPVDRRSGGPVPAGFAEVLRLPVLARVLGRNENEDGQCYAN